jgi:hypothetical protein
MSCLVSALALAAVNTDDILIKKTKMGWYSIEGKVPVYTSSIGKFATKDMRAAAEKRLGSFKKEFDRLDEIPSHEYSVEWGVEPKFRGEKVLSFLSQCHWFTGGAHPNHDSTTFNYMKVEGKFKRIHFADLMRLRIVPEALASQIVIPKLKAAGASAVTSGSVELLTADQADKFYITKDGLTWRFDPYEMGSYAEGAYEVSATWEELKGKVFIDLGE